MARVGLFQFDILWEDVAGNIEKLKHLVAPYAKERFDLLVLPELWSCGFTMHHEAYKTFDAGFAFMRELAVEMGCPVVGGLPAKTDMGQENRCYLVTADQAAYYAKIKAFKFAGEHKKYEQGRGVCRWPMAGFQVSPFVCYDLRFPELARAVMPQTDLLVYVANWPQARVHHWRHLLQARAIENLSYVIGVNRVGRDGAGLDYNGQSMIVDPASEIVLDAGREEGLFQVDIHPERVAEVRGNWPFLKDMGAFQTIT